MSEHVKRRGYRRQAVATAAARCHPETFQIYVKSSASWVRGISGSEGSTMKVAKLPMLKVATEEKSPEKDPQSSVVPHPPVRRRVDVANPSEQALRVFPHLKYHNMIFRHGEPMVSEYMLEWNAAPKVNTFREVPWTERRQQVPRTPLAQDNSESHMNSQIRARSRNAVLLRSQIRQLIVELVAFESDRRKSLVRDADAALLVFARMNEEMKISRWTFDSQVRQDSRRLSRMLARSVCVGALHGALSKKSLDGGESQARRVIAFAERQNRAKVAVLYWKKIGFSAPEYEARQSIAREEKTSRHLLQLELLCHLEDIVRSSQECCQRNAFDDFVLLKDILASSCTIDHREGVLRSLFWSDEQMERILLHFHGTFRLLSLEEVHLRLSLRKSMNDGIHLIHARESSAIKIQAMQRGILARKEVQQRKTKQDTKSVTELGFKEVMSRVSTRRSVVMGGLRLHTKGKVTTRSCGFSDDIVHWCNMIEDSVLRIASADSSSDTTAYRHAKEELVSALRASADTEISQSARTKLRQSVALILKEPDSDSINLALLQALCKCKTIEFHSIIVDDELLLDAAVDGSCSYFDTLLQCLSSANTVLPSTQCEQTVVAALGNPTKRIMLAGTILRREQVLRLFELKDSIQSAWQDFYWNVSCRSLLFEEVEDGMNLREPLLLLLANHPAITIRFDEIPVCHNPKSFSLIGRMCRDVQDALLLKQLLCRPKLSILQSLVVRSGTPAMLPLSHSVAAGNEIVVESLMLIPVVAGAEVESREAESALLSAPAASQGKIRSLLRGHSQ